MAKGENIKDFGLGTVKNTLGDGWKGAKIGAGTSLVAGLGGGLAVAGLFALFSAAAPAIIAAGLIGGLFTTMGTFMGATTLGAGVGGAWGVLTGGVRQLSQSANAKEQNLEAARGQVDYSLTEAQHKNHEIREAIAADAQREKAKRFQTENPLAANNPPNKFTSALADQKGQRETAQVGGR